MTEGGVGRGEGGRGGERGRRNDHRLIGDCGTMMTGLCVCCATQACFVKYIIVDSVVVVVVVVVATMAGGRWWWW